MPSAPSCGTSSACRRAPSRASPRREGRERPYPPSSGQSAPARRTGFASSQTGERRCPSSHASKPTSKATLTHARTEPRPCPRPHLRTRPRPRPRPHPRRETGRFLERGRCVLEVYSTPTGLNKWFGGGTDHLLGRAEVRTTPSPSPAPSRGATHGSTSAPPTPTRPIPTLTRYASSHSCSQRAIPQR